MRKRKALSLNCPGCNGDVGHAMNSVENVSELIRAMFRPLYFLFGVVALFCFLLGGLRLHWLVYSLMIVGACICYVVMQWRGFGSPFFGLLYRSHVRLKLRKRKAV